MVVAVLLMLWACDSTPTTRRGGAFDSADEDLPTAEDIAYDTIAEKENIDRESASLCLKFSEVKEMMDEVQSPDGLVSAKKKYMETTQSLRSEMTTLSREEKAAVTKYQQEAEASYVQACREYEVPASGVIANLNNLIRRIDQVHTKQELSRFQDCRLGMLKGLDDIHLCVEHNSPQIPEVKRLAQTLKGKYSSKRHELGME